jgi:transposase
VFCADERRLVGKPARYQVEELPPITVRVVKHRCQRLRCLRAADAVVALLPPHVAKSCFGPRLQAAVATLSVRNRVSRDDAVELVQELLGARISSGTMDAIIDRAGEALTEPHDDLLARLRARTL